MIEEIKRRYEEIRERKRAELKTALEDGEVHDPISILISIGISVAISAASYALSAAFAPKAPRQQLGKLSGSLQLQNSEQGIFWPEIYGGGPSANIVAGSNPTYQNNANGTEGAGGSFLSVACSSTAVLLGATPPKRDMEK